MTLAELEYAEKRMQQQWYDLVMAEQEGASLQVLEQMYDSYILFLEAYNRCSDAYHRESQGRRSSASVRHPTLFAISSISSDRSSYT